MRYNYPQGSQEVSVSWTINEKIADSHCEKVVSIGNGSGPWERGWRALELMKKGERRVVDGHSFSIILHTFSSPSSSNSTLPYACLPPPTSDLVQIVPHGLEELPYIPYTFLSDMAHPNPARFHYLIRFWIDTEHRNEIVHLCADTLTPQDVVQAGLP